MAVDNVYKRMSAALSFPHAKGVYPSGTVDRYAVAWVYTGPIALTPLVIAIPEVFAAMSQIIKALGRNSIIAKTLDWYSRI